MRQFRNMFLHLVSFFCIVDGMAYDSERPLVILLGCGESVYEYLPVLSLATFSCWNDINCGDIYLVPYTFKFFSMPTTY